MSFDGSMRSRRGALTEREYAFALALPDPKAAGLPFSIVVAMVVLMNTSMVMALLSLNHGVDWASWQWGIYASIVIYVVGGVAYFRRREITAMLAPRSYSHQHEASNEEGREMTPHITLAACKRSLRNHPPRIDRDFTKLKDEIA